MQSSNIIMLELVAKGLKHLKDEVVFVGGSVAELYAERPELSDIRATQDVDCVIELSSYIELGDLEDELRKLKFAHDTSEGAPVCRWIYNGIKVDVMPTHSNVMGFSNRWYPDGVRNKIKVELPDSTNIYILSPEYYLATKFEAHQSRGGDDLRTSHDFEDIIYVLDNNDNVVDLVKNCINIKLRQYLKKQCTQLINNANIIESIDCMLPIGSQEERIYYIYEIIKSISQNNP
ncbi:nucleotidyl transferase AbiEii/AbiGii toxin family protein [Bacteroides sp. OttesenSCG-928-E20]|nr:nucleotidyl transferase AbiEii/AbiGii toxin family protein [Bacteroides sp. OttesenSCG-928-N06]MDL2299344.1 nucleotidyl transferase AbiEii/AbiGii toxin family protein [Bacteroides sp. OttesenSCG-928-E20]MDL2304682.1 nucleotidyl transferase AbiEii/AbiGii toxin family protein [Bacteroides sp. OttesenSCG-928-D19]